MLWLVKSHLIKLSLATKQLSFQKKHYCHPTAFTASSLSNPKLNVLPTKSSISNQIFISFYHWINVYDYCSLSLTNNFLRSKLTNHSKILSNYSSSLDYKITSMKSVCKSFHTNFNDDIHRSMARGQKDCEA